MAIQSGFTEEQIVALEISLAAGERRVKYNDKEVEYRSISEMLELLALMKKSLCIGSDTGKSGLFGGRRINAIHSKGLD